MFASFNGLKNLFAKLHKLGFLGDAEMDMMIKELQKILISSDVDIDIVLKISENVRKRVKKEKINGLTKREILIKAIYEEIVNMLGREKSSVKIGKQKIMIIGLFGSGKTTTAGKLAKFFSEKNLSVALISCDFHRPAAIEQLKQVAKMCNVNFYCNGKSAEDSARFAIKNVRNDVLIFDTAGRNAFDENLAKELKNLEKIINPDEILLIIPADLGHVAGEQTKAFVDSVRVTGIVITKMDSSAKGGAAIAACYESGAVVKFIGTGEKLDELELYDPVRFVSRIIGYGDIESLIEKARRAEIDEKKINKMVSGEFNLLDFREHLKSMQKMGKLSSIVNMIPGLSFITNKIDNELLEEQEKKMKKWCYIIDSMTIKERENPDIINDSRIRRIAHGSGTNEKDVRDLLKNYRRMKKMIKQVNLKTLKHRNLAKILKQIRFV